MVFNVFIENTDYQGFSSESTITVGGGTGSPSSTTKIIDSNSNVGKCMEFVCNLKL